MKEAVIYKIDLVPYTEPKKTEINIWAIVPDDNEIICIKDFDFIPNLINKYKFEQKERNHWDTTNMYKRDFLFEVKDGEIIFIKYIN